jgi:tetratricopeptide (TPR) repeat protein
MAEPADREPKARIFISYSRKDLAFVDRLEPALKARGFEPLIDRAEIYAFEDWWKRIQGLIGKADTIIFTLSPDAVASEICAKEVAHAASLNKRFAPIVCRRVADSAVPEALRRLNFVFFDDEAQFEGSVDRLAEALRTDIGWIRQHTEYGEAARHWSASGRPGGILLRSPALEEAERWIASRPAGAPAATDETQAFIAESRRGTTRRRNILTGSLAAGLVLALALAGLAYWQRGIAVQERQIAEQQRKRAEDTLAAATKTANSLVFDLAQRFRDAVGIPATLVKDILDRARGLQEELTKSGQVTPDLKRSEAEALDETSESLLAIGDTAGALATAEQVRQIFTALLAGNPSNIGWQRDLSISYERIGDVQRSQGNLSDALASHMAALDIDKRVAAANPNEPDVQRNLSISYNKVGGVQVDQGDLAGALKSFADGVAVIERLAQTEPGNAGWQDDLAFSLKKLGGVQQAQGDFAGALKSFGDTLAIRKRLVQSDPANVDRQIDLSIALDNVGDVQVAQNDFAGALTSRDDSLAISERLAQSHPGNVGLQRDVSISLNNLSDVQVALRDFAGALKSCQDSLNIAERLAQANSNNPGLQRDVAAVYAKLGAVHRSSGDHDNAMPALQKGQTIMDRLAKLAPDNAGWKRDLAWFNSQIEALTKQEDAK